MSFSIIALPRSRTTWLSRFITMPRHFLCHHDLIAEFNGNINSYNRYMAMATSIPVGDSDTGAYMMEGYQRPDTLIVVQRSPFESIQSMVNANLMTHEMATFSVTLAQEKLNYWKERADLVVDYNELDSKLDDITQLCIGHKFSDNYKAEKVSTIINWGDA